MTEGGTDGRFERPSSARIYTLIALMVLWWAANYIIGKIALREIDALLLSGLRTTLAALLVLPIFLWRRATGISPVAYSGRDLRILLSLGIVGVGINQVCFVAGLGRTSVAHSSITMGLTPMLALLVAAILGQERLTGLKLAGMAVALGGIATLNLARTAGAATLSGDLLIFGAALSFAVFAVVGKSVTRRFDSVTVNTFAYCGGSLALLPFTIWRGWGFPFHQVSWKAWLSLGYMALFPSLICYLIFYWALTYIPASRMSAFIYLQPLLATLMAIPLLGEHISLPLIAGGILVLAGVCLTERA
ncbi:MAG: DMT family transporter [Acidobacteria bacterium]|nr:DMT family transporter [Acidobacteriota bacterium]